jgi:cytochrome c-type biogenesis protein CcmH/NrfG
MRQRPLALLLALTLLAPALYAEEATTEPPVPVTDPDDPVDYDELDAVTEPQTAGLDADTAEALLLRLREENRRLRLQLQSALAKEQPAVLNEQQQWFAVGGAVGVISFTLGLLVSRGRRRRQWLN